MVDVLEICFFVCFDWVHEFDWVLKVRNTFIHDQELHRGAQWRIGVPIIHSLNGTKHYHNM